MNDTVLVDDSETIANLHEYVLNFSLTEPPPFRFDIGFKILLAVLQKKIQVFCCFSRLVELDDVGTLQFHQNLNLPPDNFLVFNVLQWDGFDCQQLVFVLLDVAPVDSTETSLAQLNRRYHVPLNYLASHPPINNKSKKIHNHKLQPALIILTNYYKTSYAEFYNPYY